MNSQNTNVNISIPSNQLAAVQEYLESLQINNSQDEQINDPQDEQVENTDYTFFCGQECEVKEVIGHRCNGTSWEFLIKWSDGGEEWISDDECNCEVLISEYLHKQTINTVYVFCRVSTKTQSRKDCVSLDAQLAELLPIANNTGCERIKVIKISKGAYKKVPKEMIDICEAAQNGDYLLIYRVDRLSRNIFDFLKEIEELRIKGVNIYSHQDRLFYNDTTQRTDFAQKILDAQKESELIGKRVQTSIDFRKRRGDHVGGVPYGKRHKRDRNGKMIVTENSEEIDIIKKVKSLDGWPQDVANYMNSQGIKKRGRFWSKQMVKNIWSQYNDDGTKK